MGHVSIHLQTIYHLRMDTCTIQCFSNSAMFLHRPVLTCNICSDASWSVPGGNCHSFATFGQCNRVCVGGGGILAGL